MHRTAAWLWMGLLGCVTTLGCSEDAPATRNDDPPTDAGNAGGKPPRDAGGRSSDAGDARSSDTSALRYRSDITPVTQVEQALEGTFIPPYVRCVEPPAGETGLGPDGQICTNVAISGATEPGRYFPDYASCEVVLTQRPYWPRPPAGETKPDDPRLVDQAYLAELGWVTEQIAATGCVCCHDSRTRPAGQWDINLGPLWMDSLSNSGAALFAGLADSSVLGAYPSEDNLGFDRTAVGIPSTDPERMQKFMLAELARRGVSEDQARAVPPFGGPIYANKVAVPERCEPGEGVLADQTVRWKGGPARYVYVMSKDSDNPGVPPNLDLPDGTLFRLDVLPSEPPVASGFAYGSTPEGSFQAFPEENPAQPLELGTTYHLTVLRDVGLPVANCLFEYGSEPVVVTPPAVDAGPASDRDGGVAVADAAGASCSLAGGDPSGFGAPCRESSECTCEASYCALMPGQTRGYCSKTGCDADEALCPTDWTCLDLSAFAPGQPAICTK